MHFKSTNVYVHHEQLMIPPNHRYCQVHSFHLQNSVVSKDYITQDFLCEDLVVAVQEAIVFMVEPILWLAGLLKLETVGTGCATCRL